MQKRSKPVDNAVLLPWAIAEELRDLNNRLTAIQSERLELIRKTVAECDHPLECVYERPYRPYMYLSADPPWLICIRCGYTEEGWGCGFTKLSHAEFQSPKIISVESWNKLATIRFSQNDKTNSR
jgi:hypothetical protein